MFVESIVQFKEFEKEYDKFSVNNIDKDFKTKLYESFLKQTEGLKTLGQFFTPRKVIRNIVEMTGIVDFKGGDIEMEEYTKQAIKQTNCAYLYKCFTKDFYDKIKKVPISDDTQLEIADKMQNYMKQKSEMFFNKQNKKSEHQSVGGIIL